MRYVKNQLPKGSFDPVTKVGSVFIVRVNEREEDDVVIFDECVLPEYPTEEKMQTLAQAAREQDEERRKREEVRKLKSEIEVCKNELHSLDYKSIKRMQGELSDEEWEVVCNTCRNLRERIGTAESTLASMDGERDADSGVEQM